MACGKGSFGADGPARCMRTRDQDPREPPGASGTSAGPSSSNGEDEGQLSKRSRSQLKRESASLTQLGAELVELSRETLVALDLDADLLEALVACKPLAKNARLRQLRFIGKLLRARDTTRMTTALELKAEAHAMRVAREHRLEAWRKRLLEGGDGALQAYVEEHPQADRNHLRSVIRSALRPGKATQRKRAERELLRTLRADAVAPAEPEGGSEED